MISQAWKPLTPVTTQVDARPPGLWVCVLDFIEGAFKLKITATGTWQWAPDRDCTADGDPGERAPGDLLVPSAPLGALIGKIGGSTCDKGEWLGANAAVSSSGLTRPAVFAVGTQVVIVGGADSKTSLNGSLFLAMNDSPLRSRYHSGHLTISIAEV